MLGAASLGCRDLRSEAGEVLGKPHLWGRRLSFETADNVLCESLDLSGLWWLLLQNEEISRVFRGPSSGTSQTQSDHH